VTSEEWRPIVDVPGYEVSNIGRVKSLARVVPNGQGGKLLKDRVLSPWKANGYYMVQCGRGVKRLVHRLVAIAFIGEDESRPQVNHKNGIRTDNRVENLEWMTCSENHLHSFRELGRKAPRIYGKENSLSKWHAARAQN
jgi:hypothetical protein